MLTTKRPQNTRSHPHLSGSTASTQTSDCAGNRLTRRPCKTHPNALGRTGLGSTSHCAHTDGKDITRHYLDWRPFRYFTTHFAAPEHRPGDPVAIPSQTETTEFIPNDAGGTIVTHRIRIDDRSDEALDEFRQVLLPLVRAGTPLALAQLLEVLQEDAAALGLVESGDPEDAS
jgi:hypothetical protein